MRDTQNITQMLHALFAKYPTKHVSIRKHYDMYAHSKEFKISYQFYIEDIKCITTLSWNKLKDTVQYWLNKE